MKQAFPRRAIHLDFHTMPGIYDVGRDFDAEEFAKTLENAGVEYINAFARCNLGFTYYPTEVGIMHPGLQTDMLGPMVESCHKRGIGVSAYINVGIDHEHALRHREWCKVNKEGQVYNFQQMWHFFRCLCLNTGYRDHLLAMAKEVIDRYPVDGLFLDCFDLSPCYGVECIDGMRALDMDPNDHKQVANYCGIVTGAFLDDVKALADQCDRELNLYFNGVAYRKQPTHVEMEVLPSGGWGYDCLTYSIRYARTLGKPYATMTGRFHGSWGDFGGIRTEDSLAFDCYYSIANGGACSIGDHMHPRGRLDPEVYGLVGRVYAKTRELDPWTDGAESVTEAVVVDPVLYGELPTDRIVLTHVQGSARMLSELKSQFDVSDGDIDLSKYRLIILPDNVSITERLKHQLQQHLSGGGAIISSAFSGLNAGRSAFALDEYRMEYKGPEPYNVSFFEAMPEVARDLPRMLTTIYNPGIAMEPGEGTQVLAKLHQPYFNKGSWDWHHENLYIPPEKDSGRPALVRCGNIFHLSFPVFTSYFEHAVVAYKTLVQNCLDLAMPDPLLKMSRFPSFGQATITKKDGMRIVHLLTYVPELRGNTQMIEEPIVVTDVELALRMDDRTVRQVYLAPSRQQIPFRAAEGYAWITVPKVEGYQMVVFE